MAKAGDVIGGKYRLIHPLGIGGMGTVWRAEHTALRQQVAVKLLDARGPAADRAVKRFQREAQIAASIRHRNIVYISDFGTDGGAPYLVMELLNGVPLSERIVVGEPLSVMTFLRIIGETLDGLAAVHAAGVVHRDMKPENIFLVRDGSTVLPKLLDFGVSRSAERGQGHTITREGIVMGTPEYVSPEQARGKMADVRSDIYSLGVVIYEALAGRLPFQADNAADLIVAVLNADPIPLFVLRPDLGEGLSQLVGRAMLRSPADRFQSAEEMRLAIEQYLEANPQCAERNLPRRFVAPPGGHSTPATVQSDPPLADSVPTRAQTSSGDAEVAGMRSLFDGSRKQVAIFGVAGVAAIVALVLLALSGGKPNPPALAADADKPASQLPTAAPAGAQVAPDEVTVELFGVPSNGKVYADGVMVEGTSVRLARGSGTHEITVRADGHEPWHVLHEAERDGRYALALEPLTNGDSKVVVEHRERSTAKPDSSAPKPTRSPGVARELEPAKPAKSSKDAKLLRTPDF